MYPIRRQTLVIYLQVVLSEEEKKKICKTLRQITFLRGNSPMIFRSHRTGHVREGFFFPL